VASTLAELEVANQSSRREGAAVSEATPSPLNNVITIDDDRIKNHLGRVVRGSVEETLNALLDAEADRVRSAMSAVRHGRTRGPATTRAICRQRPARFGCAGTP
jgi:hypothetical protein